MKNIVRLANQFILLRGVDRLPLDMERLRMLCAAEKLVLLSYGEAGGLDRIARAASPHQAQRVFAANAGRRSGFIQGHACRSARSCSPSRTSWAIAFSDIRFTACCEQNFENNAQEREADTFALHILAPPCVLREPHLRTVGEIQAETLLDREQAVLALQRLRRYRRADRLDAEVLDRFGLTRNPRENILEKRAKRLVHLLASLLIVAGGIYHLRFLAYKAPYTDTVRTPA